MAASIETMEAQYGFRYERAPWGLFPVTHKLDGSPLPFSGKRRAWACISIGNVEVLNWSILSDDGERLIHGSEQNLARTKSGYYQMIRRALTHVRCYGAVRVYPRRNEDRAMRVEIGRRWAPSTTGACEVRP